LILLNRATWVQAAADSDGGSGKILELSGAVQDRWWALVWNAEKILIRPLELILSLTKSSAVEATARQKSGVAEALRRCL
jgi:hypothetical protein